MVDGAIECARASRMIFGTRPSINQRAHPRISSSPTMPSPKKMKNRKMPAEEHTALDQEHCFVSAKSSRVSHLTIRAASKTECAANRLRDVSRVLEFGIDR